MAKHLTQDIKNQAIESYKNGSTIEEIINKFSLSKQSFWRIRKQYGLSVKKPFSSVNRILSNKEKLSIVDNFNNGKNIEEIAKIFLISRKKVITALESENIIVENSILIYKDKILEMFNNKISIPKIAKEIGFKRSVLERYLKKWIIDYDIKIKDVERHPNWKGGRINKRGYKFIKLNTNDKYFDMGGKSRYVAEHRYIMAKCLERSLSQDETVHHIDGDRLNNKIENLQLMQGKHASGQCYKCNKCGSMDVSPYEIFSNGEGI